MAQFLNVQTGKVFEAKDVTIGPETPVKIKKVVERVAVVCLECGRKFKTATVIPTCPQCGGSDIEVQ
jgi:predicted transcriptional regulator